MKTTMKIMMFAMCLATMTSCYRVTPNADQESVLVMKPFFGGSGGVDQNAVNSGAEWVAVTTDHVEFVITPVTITEEFDNMMPADNTPVNFSAYLKVQIRKGQSPLLYKGFGQAWYENSLKATFRTMVRDKASAYKMFDLASKREVSSDLESSIYKDIAAYATKLNIPVDIMQVSIGAITPPEQVLTETKLTAAQNQSVLTQVARKTAEESRKGAEIAKAEADKAYMVSMGMTIAQYVDIRKIEISKETVEIIKDKKDVTMIVGAGIQPMYNVK